MKQVWLSIIGVGEDGLSGLGRAARDAIDGAEIFIGGERHLAMLKNDPRPRHTWGSPLAVSINRVKGLKGRQVCVLASGDPMSYGIGVTLTREISPDECLIIAHQSAFSMVCSRLGWALSEVDTLTLHGRPLALINRHLRPHARLLILSEDGNTPKHVAQILKSGGYGNSQITVFEHMGGPKEKRFHGVAKKWRRTVKDLNTFAVHCVADQNFQPATRRSGLPDALFQNDGMLTKQEVRAVTLSAIAPAPREVFWDVGSGSGSIAIEFLRAEPTAKAFAIEQDLKRIEMIRSNGETLGVENLIVVQGEAPVVLKGLEKPHVIFIGGGVSNAKLLQACWRALRPGGRLIANAVSMEGEAGLYAFMLKHDGELSQISISKMKTLGASSRLHAWNAMRTVTQYKGKKI